MRLTFSEKIYGLLSYILIVILVVMCLYPLLYVFFISIVSEQEWVEKGGLILWPSEPNVLAYQRLFDGALFLNSIWISFIRTFLGTIIGMSMTIIAGYFLSRKDVIGRKVFIFMVLFMILLHPGLIPQFIIVRDLNMLDTLWPLILPVIIDISWFILVLKQFFQNVPREMEESAQMDGCSEFQLMIRIMLPASMPAIAAITLFMTVAHWNAWFDAFIFISSPEYQPLQLIIRNSFVNPNIGVDLDPTISSEGRVGIESLKNALAIIGIIPIMLIYPFLQKHFGKGMYLGSVKG